MILNNTEWCKVNYPEVFFMPKSLLQEIVFTVLMVLVMVYAMI